MEPGSVELWLILVPLIGRTENFPSMMSLTAVTMAFAGDMIFLNLLHRSHSFSVCVRFLFVILEPVSPRIIPGSSSKGSRLFHFAWSVIVKTP